MWFLIPLILGMIILPVESLQAQRPGGPPPEAFNVCKSKPVNSECAFNSPHGTIRGSCRNVPHGLVCVPGQRPNRQTFQRPDGDDQRQSPGGNQQRRQTITPRPADQGTVVTSPKGVTGGYMIVDTGQSSCYDASYNPKMWNCPKVGQQFYGQDAQYTRNPPRYADNGNDTVSDLVTGLMWQKSFKRDIAWSDAPALAAKADIGGYSDWRVPTIKELYSIMNFDGATGRAPPNQSEAPSDAEPYINDDVYNFEYPSSSDARFIDAQYITRSAYAGYAMGNAAFFGVNFADGRIKGYPQRGRRNGLGWYLRLVRGNPNYGNNAFQDNGNGTVTDQATGLVWTQADSGGDGLHSYLKKGHYSDGRMDWSEALAFCENLTFAESDTWRLPNAKELQSLVDYTRSPQTTKSAAINPMFDATQFTDEAGNPNFPGYWTSTSHLDGRSPGNHAVVVFFGEALGAPSFGPPGSGNRQGSSTIMDVHGAGAQRSDPKSGNPNDYPKSGQGPQGDVVRVFNYVRCVRTAD